MIEVGLTQVPLWAGDDECALWNVSQRYLSAVPPTERVWHKPFLRWVRAQGRSPDAPSIHKNVSGPVGIPLKMGASR